LPGVRLKLLNVPAVAEGEFYYQAQTATVWA
jgi:hypothetical protein